jgi:hypothetical protein
MQEEHLSTTMHYYTVTDARYVRDFTIWTKLADGSEGEIDLADELSSPIFEPLKDVNYFRDLSLAEYGAICWPNGADIAPEFSVREGLRSRVTSSRLCLGPLGHSEDPTPQTSTTRVI